MSGGNPRRPRVAQAIRAVLSNLISQEFSDPRVTAAGLITVNNVELNSDMSIARVYVSFFGVDERVAVAATRALDAGSGRLRGPLGRELRLGRMPELRFELDSSPEFSARLRDIVREDEERAEASDRSEDGDGVEAPDETGETDEGNS